MPIYAYRCSACGHAKDVLQKLSDPMLSTCPACGAETFSKQVTAAGFQLKGSGWYATDFKGGAAAPAAGAATPAEAGLAKADPKTDTKTDVKTEAKTDSKSADGPSASAGSCGGSCACH
ncbi:FmdB family zinc ribbon protein [Ideonella sp. A 288]|uniref:FmdB family zinc ribbon protein n=1 Tax=Ideonella sp. A 288 TaxID=1962181 RepID=UPI000B4B5BAE|nr:zinc ribbon domain-containing protein [Ideonella sp. A 288]